MNQRNGTKVLGIAVGDRSLLIAEVSSAGASPQVDHAAEFPFPAGVTLQQPEQLGHSLLQFLKQQHFTARTAVIGIPAKWLLTKKKEVPAAAEKLVTETLRLQAEGEFSSELHDLVYEFSGQASPTEARPVLLMAIPRRYIDQITTLAESARLRAQAITPYTAALGAVASRGSKIATLLVLGPGGAEFASQQGPSPRALRYLGPAGQAPLLAGELRRNMALIPQNGDATGNGHARPELTVWNDTGLDEVALRTLTEALGTDVKCGDLRSLGVTPPAASDGRDYGTAVALALTGMQGVAPPADFLHSRLAPVPEKSLRQRVTLAALVGVVVLAVVFFAWSDLHKRQDEAAARTAEFDRQKSAIATADAMVKKVEFARAWHAGNPKYLAFLRDLTNDVPEDGQIYLTSLDLKEPPKDPKETATANPEARDAAPKLKGTLSGKATRADSALKVIDRLRADSHFSNVERVDLNERDVNRNSREVSFRCSFTYIPKD